MSEIYTMPGHLIRRLHQISVSVFTDRMKAHGYDLTAPQFATLSVLAANPGVDQATLAGLIAHDRPTIGGVVERLESKGLIQRRMSTTDRRAKILTLTEEGKRTLDALKPIIADFQVDILPGLTAAEQAEFVRLAVKAADAGNALSRAPLTLPDRAKTPGSS